MEKLAGKVSEAGDEANKVQDEAQREAGKEAVQVEDSRLMVLGARAEKSRKGMMRRSSCLMKLIQRMARVRDGSLWRGTTQGRVFL
jgi:hypothetical protein